MELAAAEVPALHRGQNRRSLGVVFGQAGRIFGRLGGEGMGEIDVSSGATPVIADTRRIAIQIGESQALTSSSIARR